MASNENYSEALTTAPVQRGNSVLHPLHEVAMRIADVGLNRSKAKTKDLVNLLLCHGARAWRNNQPEANIHLHISARYGRAPINIRIR